MRGKGWRQLRLGGVRFTVGVKMVLVRAVCGVRCAAGVIGWRDGEMVR